MNRFPLANKTGLVAGAASGIGAATARVLRSHGRNVTLLDLHLNAVQTVARSIGDRQTPALGAVATDPRSLAVQQSVDHFGTLDVVFANAGMVTDPQYLR
ncbi:SDR family NAD(P)-dependent oxidoreductase [Kitasatospora paranensis]|uniref:SDR family NAD(P)-dependent oxidoreductase n=1 Tax=Kitasatospora paranensis TaxID=258053 RepID=A0ABW2GA44_9ACTN